MEHDLLHERNLAIKRRQWRVADRVSQTSLREMIGSSMLSALLSERTAADELLRGEIGRKTADWGISVKSVEIRDVAIPVALQMPCRGKPRPSARSRRG
jgi:regulator of protease activity HflC (stomatin/prohibitin superfamily)